MTSSKPERAESGDEIFYAIGDRFYVQQQDLKLKSEPTKTGEESEDVLISPGDILAIRSIDLLSEMQPARSIKEMTVYAFHRGHDHPYAICKITPEELSNFPRERRKTYDSLRETAPSIDTISDKRVNQLANRKYTRVREKDTAEQMRQLMITAMQIKIRRALKT